MSDHDNGEEYSIALDSTEDNHSSSEVSKKEPSAEYGIGQRETKFVVRLRRLVCLVLVISMGLVAFVTYYYLSNSERDDFEQRYHENAHKVLATLGASLDKAIAGVDAFVIDMLSYARGTEQTWPFVTIPDFEARSAKFLSLTKAIVFQEYVLVTPTTRSSWEAYSKQNGPAWAEKSIDYLKRNDLFQDQFVARNITKPQYVDVIHDYSAWGVEDPQGLPQDSPGPFLPMWQSAPLIPSTPVYNWDLATVVDNESVLNCIRTHKVSLSKAYCIAEPGDTSLEAENEAWADYFSSYITTGEEPMEPISDFYYPIIDDLLDFQHLRSDPNYNTADHKVGGIMSQSGYWRDFIKDILPQGSNGMVAVFESGCNPTFTYEINGPSVRYMGVGDFHDAQYDDMVTSSTIQNLNEFYVGDTSYSYVELEQELCPWTVYVYPSQTMEDSFRTRKPAIFTVVVVAVFAFASAVFVLYDYVVERRQKVVARAAAQSSAIVSSLFPSNVRDRLLQDNQQVLDGANRSKDKNKNPFLNNNGNSNNHRSVDALRSVGTASLENIHSSPPIADVFPEATVLFADLSGFTAWSSSRDPVQVFTLLEVLYGAFDKIANRRGVFKIETIGDCYLAVCGLPEPRRHHAIVMIRFAADCRAAMNSRTRELELTLGPGTADLQLRCGLNSGAVTAGVLRGEKSRFQLFGDTVNTAARMETNGVPNRIHVSQKTADQIQQAGKQDWLTAREDLVDAKGKGKMQTYWAEPTSFGSGTSRSGTSVASGDSGDPCMDGDVMQVQPFGSHVTVDGMIQFNSKIFEGLIKKLLAHRQSASGEQQPQPDTAASGGTLLEWKKDLNVCVRDEVVLSVPLPAFRKIENPVKASSILLEPNVRDQLRDFVSVIARMYRANPFHNFDHATHVTMSTSKLLQRIHKSMSHTLSQQEVYIHSFGVASDPLTQLAVVFSALIHDVDHRGVSNPTLVEEDPKLAQRYQYKSIAEQNSVDMAWDVFMGPEFTDLRGCLFATQDDLQRFRQLVVNSVMASDIFDPELKSMRDERWNLAFSESARCEDSDAMNRKATIVLEHVIQASDVCHTMQHWTVYQKWNRCLFEEMMQAYSTGRTDKDPSLSWYKGELWFFDNYVIPLAKKLKECQVFGVSGHEFLDYAYENRLEWEAKGNDIVQEMAETFAKKQKAAKQRTAK